MAQTCDKVTGFDPEQSSAHRDEPIELQLDHRMRLLRGDRAERESQHEAVLQRREREHRRPEVGRDGG